MINNIELASIPGSMASNWELFKKKKKKKKKKINLAPIDLLASPQVKMTINRRSRL